MSPCQSAGISAGCGFLTGGIAGAIGNGSGLVNCACSLLNNISLPAAPPSTPPPTEGCLVCGIGIGGGGGWSSSGQGWAVSISVPGSDCSTGGAASPGSPGSVQAKSASNRALPSSFPRLQPAQKDDLTQGVCATVRIQIDQDVVMRSEERRV